MANTALSFMVAALAGIPALYGAISKITGSEFVFVLGALVIHFAIQTYKRFDRYAAIALNVAAAIESDNPQFRTPPLGFDTVFAGIQNFASLDITDVSRTYKRIRLVGYGACAIFILGAALIIFEWIPKPA